MSLLIDFNGSVARRCSELSEVIERLAAGELDVPVRLSGSDPLGEIASALSSLQKNLREAQELRDREYLRLRCALQNVSTNIMIADNDLRIVYMNQSIRRMFEDALPDIRKDLPAFDPSNLMGRCIDEFHRDPGHQRRILQALDKDAYRSRITIGGRVFDLCANAVFDDSGRRVGSVVEWADRTADLRIEAEQKRLADEGARLRCAVENVSTNIMIADNDFRIVFLNRAVQGMFENALDDIRKDLPAFDPSSLMGRCIDEFHKRPEHQRAVLQHLGSADSYKARITIGGRFFDLTANPVYSDGGERIGSVVEWYDRTDDIAAQNEEERRKAEMLRIKTALDNVSTNTMLCDENMKIVYMNKAIVNMFRVAENDIQKDLPSMHADKLMGRCIDDFHKVPAHQRRILDSISDTYRSQITIGGRTFALSANPIVDEAGQRHGAVVEWVDRTVEVQVEEEIGQIVNAAVSGDFSRRIALEGKHAFFKILAESVNKLIDVCEQGLSDVMRVLAALARGDLTQRIDAEYGGVFGELRDNANATSESLQGLITQIRAAVEAVTVAAEEIAAGNADLSQRTEEQASSLEETASSMEELTTTVRQNAENARQANDLAIGARDVALKGGDVVQDVVATMSAINDSSRKVVEIISVIDGIAFQTNILALNAAVEAARAGEQGRGFAVVAGEVRNLAQRSAGAAKEIKALIGGSVEKVDDGTRLVQQAGSTMNEIVQAVKRVTELISHIAQASLEQSSGIEEVNTAVVQMDQITQQNAAVVEQAAAAAASLEEQARALSETVGTFRVDDSSAPAQPAAAAVLPVPKPVRSLAKPTPRRLPRAGSAADGNGDWKTF